MYTKAQKKATMKWIDRNKERWNELCKEHSKTYYENNKETVQRKMLGRYYLKKEMELFRKILL